MMNFFLQLLYKIEQSLKRKWEWVFEVDNNEERVN